MTLDLVCRDLGVVEYEDTWERMKQFTQVRSKDDADEIWLLEHPSLFTQGQAGKEEHLLAPGDIPVYQADRGGQVTYHGPGQLIAYVLIDLKRLGIGVRDLVSVLENSIVKVLALNGIEAYAMWLSGATNGRYEASVYWRVVIRYENSAGQSAG